MDYRDIYRKCIKIRLFEKKVESEFGLGHMRGTTHGCIGQEIISVLVMENVDRRQDYITGTHRCHGQILAYDENPYALACEMMGKKDGYAHGMGGSQHIKVEKYITNGITGGMVTIAVGIAMGMKKENGDGIVIAFAGDGGINEGYVQESLNLASHFKLPVLFVCENNGYAMSTPTEKYSAGNFRSRISALDIKYMESKTLSPDTLETDINNAFLFVRKNRSPCFLDIHTARLCGHSKSDLMEYMSEEEKERHFREDPVLWVAGKLTVNEVSMIDTEVSDEINSAFEKAGKCEEFHCQLGNE